MSIAPYTMRDLQKEAHIDQEEALRAFSRLKGRVFVPKSKKLRDGFSLEYMVMPHI